MGLKYKISEAMVTGFNKMCTVGDAPRLANEVHPTDVTQVVDLEYIPDGTWEHKLDVYYPEGTPTDAKLPVVIDIHGGGWGYGDKELNKNYNLHIAQRGFVVVNISYRLCPTVTIKDQMQDCMAALKYAGEVLKEYPADLDRVYLTGDSAGGQLASHCAALNISEVLRSAYDTVDPKLNIKGVAQTSGVPYLNEGGVFSLMLASVLGKGAKKEPFYSYLDFEDVVDACDEIYPPTIFFTCISDVVAEFQTRRAYKMLKGKGIDTKLSFKWNPKLMHVYPIGAPDTKYGAMAIDDMVAFFDQHQ